MEAGIKILKNTIVGVDYGNKYAGTTVICYNDAHKVRFIAAPKNADADSFLISELNYIKPDLVMIDAPLSLPGVYWLGDSYSDFFFRKCDRDLKAMSPMFLGGLTARAMALRYRLNGISPLMYETYPRKLVDLLDLPLTIYKKKKGDLHQFAEHLADKLGIRINTSEISSWHHTDALLAFISGIRFLEDLQQVFGTPEEGIIIV